MIVFGAFYILVSKSSSINGREVKLNQATCELETEIFSV